MLVNTGLQQKGVALIMSIVLLLVITVVAIGSIRSTTMQERMSANFQEGMRLFQGSENKLGAAYAAALIAAEAQSSQENIAATTASGITSNGSLSQHSISLAFGHSEFVYRNYNTNVTSWIDHDSDGVLDVGESSSSHSQGVSVLVPLID